MNDKFWAVWKENTGQAPAKKHETKEAAITEAGRLAQKENAKFLVLEVIGFVEPNYPPINYFDLP